MHKVGAERMKEEVILEIMGNQEESQKGGGLNQEDRTIAGIMGNQGTKRNIFGIEIKMKEINQMETRRQMW